MKSTLLASLLITSTFISFTSSVFAQTNTELVEPAVTVAAPCIAAPKKPKNVILLIGDGTGLAQWSAAQASTKDNLQVFNLVEHIGLSKTSSASNWVTDSGAGATAFSIGEKTFNKAIGVRADSTPAFTLSEILHVKGKGTGLVATCGLTHATPASFYAHQVSRYMDKEIANDFYSGFIDVAIGGGYPWYDSAKLSQAGYQRFVCNKDSLHKINTSKFIAFYDTTNNVPKFRDGRGDFLTNASMAAIRNLSQNPNGFFLMIEGSQIDWGGHDNDADYVITETLDFDKTIGAIGAWAKENGETLVIITADHETGGLTMPGYDKTAGRPVSLFSTKDHTGIPVPVFSFGPGSEAFKGVYENNTIHQKILQSFGE